MLNVKWDFLIGVFIGLLVSLFGYCINHVLRLREARLVREFEMRKEGKDFYLPLYGFFAELGDLATGYVRAVRQGKAQVLVKQGFPYLTPDEIVSKFKTEFKELLKFIGEARAKGYEVLLPLELSEIIADILAIGSVLCEGGKDEWDSQLIQQFDEQLILAMNTIEELLWLKRKK